MARIYTRTGDDGTTGLFAGDRISKADPRIEAIGAVDEANAAIGMARLHGAAFPEIDAMLARVQHELFDLGAELATPAESDAAGAVPRMADTLAARLESEIDRIDAGLPPLHRFVLPGGTPLAAGLHLARTAVRRAERAMVALEASVAGAVSTPAFRYVNRLSDLLFVAARAANDRGAADVLWVPAGQR